ncbi:MAG: hypothetical protein V1672_03355 [Candidatus Diapherotrites archaeon]
MKLRINKTGQMFEGYRLIIGAIMAIMILVIILGMITYLQNIQMQISQERMYDGLKAAKKTPDGSVVVRENLIFTDGQSYSQNSFANQINLASECVTIQSKDSSAYELLATGTLNINTYQTTNVYFKCFMGGDCDITCVVSFGKPFE